MLTTGSTSSPRTPTAFTSPWPRTADDSPGPENPPVARRLRRFLGAGDVNDDGIIDLVASAAFEIQFWRGSGDGSFSFESRIETGAPPLGFQARTFQLLDSNDDGHLDILASDASREIALFLGDGSGGFRRTSVHRSFQSLADWGAADFDADGLIDLLVADLTGVHYFRGTRDAEFEDRRTAPIEQPVAVLAIGDYLRDAVPDAVSVERDGGLTFYRVVGGELNATSIGDLPDVGARFGRTVDYDGDGNDDLVLSGDVSGETIRILLGTGHGTFDVDFTSSFGFPFTDLQFADFTGDRRTDALLVASGRPDPVLFFGTDTSRFARAQFLALDRGPRGIEIVDTDGDGLDEIVAVTARDLVVVPHQGAFGLGPPYRLDVEGDSLHSVVSFAAGAGEATLVVSDELADTVSRLRLGADGRLRDRLDLETESSPRWLVAGAFIEDGRPEVAVSFAASPTIALIVDVLGDPRRRSVVFDADVLALVGGDLDGDGRDEVVVATPNGIRIASFDALGGARIEEHAELSDARPTPDRRPRWRWRDRHHRYDERRARHVVLGRSITGHRSSPAGLSPDCVRRPRSARRRAFRVAHRHGRRLDRHGRRRFFGFGYRRVRIRHDRAQHRSDGSRSRRRHRRGHERVLVPADRSTERIARPRIAAAVPERRCRRERQRESHGCSRDRRIPLPGNWAARVPRCSRHQRRRGAQSNGRDFAAQSPLSRRGRTADARVRRLRPRPFTGTSSRRAARCARPGRDDDRRFELDRYSSESPEVPERERRARGSERQVDSLEARHARREDERSARSPADGPPVGLVRHVRCRDARRHDVRRREVRRHSDGIALRTGADRDPDRIERSSRRRVHGVAGRRIPRRAGRNRRREWRRPS